jgi:hypothetical protein
MNRTAVFGVAFVAGTLLSGVAFAADPAPAVQRDVNQQERIEKGLQSGQLNTREAGRLEHEEGVVDKMQARALRNGNVSAAEAARINKAQNRVSQDIFREKHDAQKGNPGSASSRRMQADVQRNINQEQRIENGVKSGQLTNAETARLERQQARIDNKEGRAARDGHVGPAEQASIQRTENRASRNIFRKKHNLRKGD